MKRLLLLLAFISGIDMLSNAQAKDEPPPPPPPPAPPKVVLTKYSPPAKELKEFYQRNPDVANLYWKSEDDIVVIHKDKTQFTYNFKIQKEKEAFEEKYGSVALKIPPPPPPPPPPAPPRSKKIS